MTAYFHAPDLPVQFHYADVELAEAGMVTAQLVNQGKVLAVRAEGGSSDRHLINFGLLRHGTISESAAPDVPVVTFRGTRVELLAVISTGDFVIAD